MNKNINKLVISLMAVCMIVPTVSTTVKAEKVEIPVAEWDAYGPLPLRYETIDTNEDTNDLIKRPYAEQIEIIQNKAYAIAENVKADPDKTGYPGIAVPAHKWLRTYAGGFYGEEEGSLFDSAKYAAANPDVVVAVGNSHEALWNHYKTVGIYEGRLGYNRVESTKEKIFQYLATANLGGKTDREKAEVLHAWICDNFTYDYDKAGIARRKGVNDSGTILGVCEDYSAAFEWGCGIMGIPCIIDTSAKYNHAWNKICLEGKWYEIDVTSNDSPWIWNRNGVDIVMDTNPFAMGEKVYYQCKPDEMVSIFGNNGPQEPLAL